MTDPILTVILRRAVPDDAADYALMMGDPEVFPSLMQLPMPSVAMWRARLEESSAPARSDLHLVAVRGGRVVGSAGLHPKARLRRRHTATLGISVVPQAQRQGVGSALMRAVCDYADQWSQLLRIELGVFTDNAPAIALYQRFGFRHEGTHRGYALRHGLYADVHSMARLHPNPPTIAWPAPSAP